MTVVSEQPKLAPALPNDVTLLERYAAGDRSGLDVLFRRYRGVAYRVAFRLLGREADALDAVQDGFVKALLHLDRFRGLSSFKTWLLRIVSNSALDLGRQRLRDARLPRCPTSDPLAQLNAAGWPEPDSELARADLRRKIDAALQRLSEPQRQTFVLHVEGGLSYREVAEGLGISIGTVMSRLYYARRKLKSLLADQVEP